ncbi:MAG: hypothetical protein Q9227_007029 [Pyrenula ochraceoflavens]
MSEYLPAFLVDPVVRQARRLSRLNAGIESPGILPESIRTWTPSSFWNTSPPPSVEENESESLSLRHDDTSRWSILGQRQVMPSPPWESTDSDAEDVQASQRHSSYPPFSSTAQNLNQSQRRTRRATLHHHASETSVNPQNELPDRSRYHNDARRGHSSSDPTSNESGTDLISTSYGQGALEEFEAYGLSREGSTLLPANDGMGQLRRRIMAIQNGSGTTTEKARLVHTIMMERYNFSRYAVQSLHKEDLARGFHRSSSDDVLSGRSQTIAAESVVSNIEVDYNLSPEDLVPSFAPSDIAENHGTSNQGEEEHDEPQLGCQHYLRNVKLQCYACKRCIVNMESQFRNLDRDIAAQPMPPEWENTRALVSCNDCGAKTTVKYHFLGLKCILCESYNTTELQVVGGMPDSPTPDALHPVSPLETSRSQLESGGMPIPRPMTATSDQGNLNNDSWLSPQPRGARSVSPVITNYFGIQRGDQDAHGAEEGEQDGEDEFWGPWTLARLRARLLQGALSDPAGDNEDSESEGSVEDDEAEEEDDDDDEVELDEDEEDDNDQIDIFGHR